MFAGSYHGKTVLVTGHTGFKGAWLCQWLNALGAKVVGYALPPPTNPSLFERAALADTLTHVHGDIRDRGALRQTIETHAPAIIFHMAAQPLVLESYRDPWTTFETNVMGSLAVLEALRQTEHPCTVVMVTTDKVYDNREWVFGYRETDALGGYDPYSASKGAMEIAVHAYRRSFFITGEQVRLATARSGNVIGGGDWAANRIVPDAIRALHAGQPIPVRNPDATRPWQHVLEPLAGYLWLGARLLQAASPYLMDAWNFGPTAAANAPVRNLVALLLDVWGSGGWVDHSDPNAPHEAGLLRLSIDKATAQLGWQPVWDFRQAVTATARWYQAEGAAASAAAVRALCAADIEAYTAQARAQGLAWAQ